MGRIVSLPLLKEAVGEVDGSQLEVKGSGKLARGRPPLSFSSSFDIDSQEML